MSLVRIRLPRIRLDSVSYERCASRSCVATVGGVNHVARCRTQRSTSKGLAAILVTIPKRI